MRTALAALLLFTLSTTVLAQHAEADDQPIYEGTWKVGFDGQRSGRLVLKDWEGTWVETGPAKTVDPACRGRKLPVTIHHSTPENLEFTAWGVTVSPGCPNTTFVMHPDGGADALQGETATKEKVRMARAGGKQAARR